MRNVFCGCLKCTQLNSTQLNLDYHSPLSARSIQFHVVSGSYIIKQIVFPLENNKMFSQLFDQESSSLTTTMRMRRNSGIYH